MNPRLSEFYSVSDHVGTPHLPPAVGLQCAVGAGLGARGVEQKQERIERREGEKE